MIGEILVNHWDIIWHERNMHPQCSQGRLAYHKLGRPGTIGRVRLRIFASIWFKQPKGNLSVLLLLLLLLPIMAPKELSVEKMGRVFPHCGGWRVQATLFKKTVIEI